MNLYLLRHGLAVERGTKGFQDDSKRPLTQEGKEKILFVAKGMKKLNLSFDLILSSPYIRAMETATIISDTYKIKTILTKNLTPEASVNLIMKEIKSKYPEIKSILLVGHEPHLSQLTSFLLAGQTLLNIDFKKGGLCSLEVDQNLRTTYAVLNWLLTPSQLKHIS